MTDHVKVVSTLARNCTTHRQRAHRFSPRKRRDERRLQSSPGYLHAGHVPSKCTWQIPQTSSSGMSQRHVATASHFLILTFIVATDVVKC